MKPFRCHFSTGSRIEPLQIQHFRKNLYRPLRRSAGCQPAVSQVANLRNDGPLQGGIAVRKARPVPWWMLADWQSAIQQVGNLRYFSNLPRLHHTINPKTL